MSKAGLEFALRAVLLGVGILAGADIAHAGTIYRGGLDPVIFNGFADINVGADCIISDGFETPGVGGCTDPVLFLDASIHITDTNLDPTADFTVTWGGPQDVITGLLWSAGRLVAIDTNPIFGSDPSGFVLQFFSDPTAKVTCAETLSIESSDDFADDDHTLCGDLALTSATQTGFDPVPEPGSLVLLAGAFGAAWLARRTMRRT